MGGRENNIIELFIRCLQRCKMDGGDGMEIGIKVTICN